MQRLWSVVKKHEASIQREAETRDSQKILAGVESLVLAVPEVPLHVFPSHKLTIHPLLHV